MSRLRVSILHFLTLCRTLLVLLRIARICQVRKMGCQAHAGLAEGEVAKEISGRELAVWEVTDKLPARYIVKLVTE